VHPTYAGHIILADLAAEALKQAGFPVLNNAKNMDAEDKMTQWLSVDESVSEQ
jgi:hypothetical protein